MRNLGIGDIRAYGLGEISALFGGGGRKGDGSLIVLGNTTVTTNNGTDTHTVASFFPANFLVLWVCARVDTIITGCTSWSIGVTADTDRYGTGLAVAATTVAAPSTLAADSLSPRWYTAATDLLFTAAGGGVVWTTGVIYYKAIGIQFNALTAA